MSEKWLIERQAAETVQRLLPCPWHGTSDDLGFDDNGVGTVWVVCNKVGCGCEGPYGHSTEEAIAKWNSRARAREALGKEAG